MRRLRIIIITVVINILIFILIFITYKFVFSKSEVDKTAIVENKVKADYRQVNEIKTGLSNLHGISIDTDDKIYIYGDDHVVVYNKDSVQEKIITIPAGGSVVCVYQGDRIYIGLKDHIEVFDMKGRLLATWQNFGSNSMITSISVNTNYVLIADAGNKLLYKYNHDGKMLQMLGKDYIIPSPYFDVAIAKDDSLWVTNPGAFKVVNYDFDGNLKTGFGFSSNEIAGFEGCCNPDNIAINNKGNIITVEKGSFRIKEYEKTGKLVGIIADENLFKGYTADSVFDVVCDSNGKVYVLDNVKKAVRVFEK